MVIPFDDASQYAIGSTSKSITTDTSIAFRWSEIVLAALRASGLFDTLIDDTTAPTDLSALWLDENTSPGSLKRWDATQTAWVPVTYEWFVNQASLDTVLPRIDALEAALTAARSVATGGTGATNSATARTNLDVPSVTDLSSAIANVDAVQLGGQNPSEYLLGQNLTDVSLFIKSLFDDADAQSARATLDAPQSPASGFININVQGVNYSLPAGGTWVYSYTGHTPAGAAYAQSSGVVAGGALIFPGAGSINVARGWAWRIQE